MKSVIVTKNTKPTQKQFSLTGPIVLAGWPHSQKSHLAEVLREIFDSLSYKIKNNLTDDDKKVGEENLGKMIFDQKAGIYSLCLGMAYADIPNVFTIFVCSEKANRVTARAEKKKNDKNRNAVEIDDSEKEFREAVARCKKSGSLMNKKKDPDMTFHTKGQVGEALMSRFKEEFVLSYTKWAAKAAKEQPRQLKAA